MPSPQIITTTETIMFPSGTPTAGDIRYELRVYSTNQVLQTVHAAPGTNPVFVQPADGTFFVRGQRDTGAGLIGPVVDSVAFTIDSRVALAVPKTIVVNVV